MTSTFRSALPPLLVAVLAPLALAACSVFGVRSTPGPAYEVVARLEDGIEVRRYGERVAAETRAEDGLNAAFRRLAGYIGGANAGGREIAMTAPVEVEGQRIAMTAPVETDGRTMRFFLPEDFTLESAPRPTDEAVRLRAVPPRTEAALRYTGLRGPERVAAKAADLQDALTGSGWKPAGTAFGYFYDPPWTLPWLRRHEAVVPVAADEGTKP